MLRSVGIGRLLALFSQHQRYSIIKTVGANTPKPEGVEVHFAEQGQLTILRGVRGHTGLLSALIYFLSLTVIMR